MTSEAQPAVSVIQDYPGLLTNSGPSAAGAPPGTAEVQTNVQCVRIGELTTRPGYRVVQFEDE